MLKIVWENGKPPTLLVGIQIGAATTENSMEVPLKKKKKKLNTELLYDSAIRLLGICPEKTKIGNISEPQYS